jgi:hypothetical protein
MNLKALLPPEDLPLIKRPTLIALVVVLFCAGLVWGALFFRHIQEQTLRAARAERAQAAQLYEQIVKEGQAIRSNLGAYQQFSRSGAMGDEDRIALVEGINQVRESSRLFPVTVEISPQLAIPVSSLETGGDAPPGAAVPEDPGVDPLLRASPVRLTLSLLHEGDLVQLLNRLHSLPGLFVSESCVIERTPAVMDTTNSTLPENLSANCRLLWITLQEKVKDHDHEP